MAGAVQVGALVINMAADVAALKTNLADATKAAQTAGQQIVGHLSAVRTSVETAVAPLQDLTVKFGSFESQVKKAQEATMSLAKGLIIGSAAGLSIDALKGKIDGVIESMAHLKEVSEKTGSSVESLSKLSVAAKQSGTDIDTIAAAMAKMARGMAGADDETKGAGKALDFLGIKAKDTSGNLKDQAAMFVEISQKLDTYRDGAGKAAIAQALFSRSGTDLLPTMKLVAEQGDIAAKVTTAQAEAALKYTRDLAKLDAQKGALVKTIATALLPSMTDFANALLDATKNTDSLGKKAKDVSSDGAMTEWADSAAMGAARLVDVIVMLPKLLSAVSGSFKAVGMDVALFATAVSDLNPKNIAKSLAKGKNPFADFKDMLADRNKTLADANQRYEELWNADGAAMEKAMAARIAARKKGAAAAKEAAEADKPVLNFSTAKDTDAKDAEKEEAAYDTLIAAIRTKINENQTELAIRGQLAESQKFEAKLDAALAAGKSKLTADHEAEVRAKLKDLAVTEDLIKAQAAQRDVTAYIADSTRARDAQAEALNVEYAMYGKTADARAIALVALDSEKWKEAELAKLRAANLPITAQILTQLNSEAAARTLVGQAALGQNKALQYAQQLADENKKFAAESIFDDKARAGALLQIDAAAWQERIRLAGDGTEAQKRLQEQYVIWYQNQLIKPQLDEQRQMWQSIEHTAHDTFISIFDSGKSAFNRLRDALKNGLLDLLYQMTMRPWIIQIGASMGFGAAAGTPAGAAAGVGTGGPGLIGSATSAASLYKMVSGGFTGIGNAVAGGVDNVLGMFGPGTIGATGPSAMASMAGTAASYGAGLLGGHYIGNAIAGDYSVNHGQAVTNIAAVIGSVLGGPIGGVIGGAVGGLINRAFGMGSTQVQAQGIRGTLSDAGLTADDYQQLHQNGGWFRSDKDWTSSTPVSDTVSNQLTQGLAAIEAASTGFAASLGVSADALNGYSKTFDLALTGDAAKDQQAFTDLLSSIGDEIAKQLVPNLDEFTKSGETASAALERLAGDFKGTDQVAQLLGTSAAQLFGSAGLDSAKAREGLIDAAGGLAALNQEATAFGKDFLNDAERLVPVQKALSDALASIGYASLQTRDDFKNAVNGLITSGAAATEVGAKSLTSLLSLTDAFNLVHPDTSAADAEKANAVLQERQDLQDQYDQLTMTSTQLLAKQRDALDASNRPLFDQIQLLKEQAAAAQAQQAAQQAMRDQATSLLSSVDSAFSVLQSVVGREKGLLQTRIDAETASISKLQSLSQALHGTLDALKGPDQAAYDRLAAQGQVKAALAIAKAGGPLPAADSLKGALSTLQQDASSQFATYADYLKDFYSTKNDIADLAGVTDDSLSVEQKSLDALNAQVKQLDGVLADAESQIAVLKGQSTTLLSIQDALQALTSAMLSARANPVVSATSAVNQAYQSVLGRAPDAAGLQFWQNQAAAGVPVNDIVNSISGSPEATLRGMYQTMLGRAPDAAGLNFWMNQVGQGVSLASVSDALANSSEAKHRAGIPGFASGGDHAGGWRIVGERGIELEATGPARIFNASQTSSILSRLSSPSDNSTALLAEVKAMRAELVQLRQANSAENVAQVKQQLGTNNLLQRVIYGGDAIQTKAGS